MEKVIEELNDLYTVLNTRPAVYDKYTRNTIQRIICNVRDIAKKNQELEKRLCALEK